MKSLCVLAGLFSLILFASVANARKDPGEHWQGVKKDEHCGSNISASNDDSKLKEKEAYVKDFEPRPNVDIKPNNDNSLTDEKSLVKDFEPRPNPLILYGNDENSLGKDFEPRPNPPLFYYGNDEKSLGKDFEPRPNPPLFYYGNDEKSLVKDFEPRPNILFYGNDAVAEEAN